MPLILGLLVIFIILVADLWLSIPQILYAIEPSLIQTGFAGATPRALQHPQTREAVRKLGSIGFAEMGPRWERVWALDTKSWEVCLASERAQAWAGVARTGRLNASHMLYLLTPFADGGFLMTEAGTGDGYQGEGMVYQRSPAESLDDLVQMHRETLEREVAAGREVTSALDRPSRLSSCRAYYAHPQIRVRRRRRGLGTVFLSGVLLVFFSALAVWWVRLS